MAQEAYLVHIPAYILSAEFILGGIVRLSPFPFQSAHADIITQNRVIAPLLYPLIPSKDATSQSTYVGSWFLLTGAIWGLRSTRGRLGTLGISLFWSSFLVYTHSKLGLDIWLPVANVGLGVGAWWLESRVRNRRKR